MFKKIINFFKSIVDEAKKVIWPDKETVTRHSVMVIVTVIVSILVVAGIDYVFQKLLMLTLAQG